MAGNCDYAVVPFVCDTDAGGTQDITRSGFGTPVAALFFVCRATSLDTNTAHAMLMAGMSDFTNERVAGTVNEDDEPATIAHRWMATDKAVRVYDENGGLEGDADATTTTDGITLTWSDPNSNPGYQGFVVMFGGADTSADSGTFNCNSSDDDVTDPGFEPDLVFVASTRGGTGASASTNMALSFGWATNVSDEQISANDSGQHGAGTSANGVILDSGDAGRNLFTSTAFGGAHITDFDANGFTAEQIGGGGMEGQYLALKFDGCDVKTVGFEDLPTGTGSESYTGAGFKPGLVMTIPTSAAAGDIDTENLTANPEAIAWGIGAADGTSERCMYYTVEDNTATMNTSSFMASSVLSCNASDQSDPYEADWDSFDSDGVTVVVSAATGTALQFGLLYIEENQAGGDTEITQNATETVEVTTFAADVNARNTLTQTATETIEVQTFQATVKASTGIAQVATETIEVQTFAATVRAQTAVAQVATETIEVQTFAATVTAVTGTAIDQVATETIAVQTFPATVITGGATVVEQVATETIEVQTFPAVVLTGGALHIKQQAVVEIEIATFKAMVHPIQGWAGWACHKNVVLDVAHDANVTLDVAHDADVTLDVVVEADLLPSCGPMTIVDFDLFTGTHKTLLLTVKDGGGSTVDISIAGPTTLTAANWIMQADADDTTDYVGKSWGSGIEYYTDGTDGIIEVTILPADSVDIDASTADLSYYHQLKVTVDSQDSVVAEGTPTIKQTMPVVADVELAATAEMAVGVELPVGTLNVT